MDFRSRQGREELIRLLPAQFGQRIVELGGGTGRNLEFFGSRLASFASVEVIDLCQPLLDVAAARSARMKNIRLTRADTTTYRPRRTGRLGLFLLRTDHDPGLATRDR